MDWRDDERGERRGADRDDNWVGDRDADRVWHPESVVIIVIVVLVFLAPFLRFIF